MRLSKLEVCVAIIKTLSHKGPQTSSEIEAETKTKADTIKECLDLLVEQTLVERKSTYNLETYANTERGSRVLAFFHVLPLQEIRKVKIR